MSTLALNFNRPRSFVRRDSRMTAAQRQAFERDWPRYGLTQEMVLPISPRPRFVEIGFGSGQSLLALAKAEPHCEFIGIETHKPGIGALLLGINAAQLTNITIFYGDAIPIFSRCFDDNSLDGVQIFFPDPWPKRRHHQRRLIQPDFIKLLCQKLKINGSLHLATDWSDYAKHMMRILSQESALQNGMGFNQFANRSVKRPIITKFEQRALKAGRTIWDLQFHRCSLYIP